MPKIFPLEEQPFQNLVFLPIYTLTIYAVSRQYNFTMSEMTRNFLFFPKSTRSMPLINGASDHRPVGPVRLTVCPFPVTLPLIAFTFILEQMLWLFQCPVWFPCSALIAFTSTFCSQPALSDEVTAPYKFLSL